MTTPAQFVPDPYDIKHFRVCAVKFNLSDEEFDKAADKLRFFEIEGKPVRALKYDPQILSANRESLNKYNVFVKGIPKDMKAKDLYDRLNETPDYAN